MAIFGKKKDKSGGDTSVSTNNTAGSPPPSASAGGPPSSVGHAGGASSSAPGGVIAASNAMAQAIQQGVPPNGGMYNGAGGPGGGSSSIISNGAGGSVVGAGSSSTASHGRKGSFGNQSNPNVITTTNNAQNGGEFGSPGAGAGTQGGTFNGVPAGYMIGGPGSMSGGGPGSVSSHGGGHPMSPQGTMMGRRSIEPGAGPGGSTLGPPAAGGAPRQVQQQVVYPWSQRQLVLEPPRFLDATRQAPPGTLSPSPFPRYGLAANSTASATGEVYLFGGLVRESVKNDLYTVHVERVSQPPVLATGGIVPGAPPPPGSVSATLVQTMGEIPPPRVGHATVLVSNVLILWGGDTKVRADDKQDEGLYLLNLSTREWTRVTSVLDGPNACPMGRYGHTVAIVGSKFYVFGGQVDGLFLNDLWAFDLNTLKGSPQWQLIKPLGDAAPPQRTGHASVTYKDKIYIFGGTDGQYHYNDTWSYDVTTNTWSELSCIGYIPVPREGHSTCLVDDVMYIFGGRGVDGKDLGDLASFKISSESAESSRNAKQSDGS